MALSITAGINATKYRLFVGTVRDVPGVFAFSLFKETVIPEQVSLFIILTKGCYVTLAFFLTS